MSTCGVEPCTPLIISVLIRGQGGTDFESWGANDFSALPAPRDISARFLLFNPGLPRISPPMCARLWWPLLAFTTTSPPRPPLPPQGQPGPTMMCFLCLMYLAGAREMDWVSGYRISILGAIYDLAQVSGAGRSLERASGRSRVSVFAAPAFAVKPGGLGESASAPERRTRLALIYQTRTHTHASLAGHGGSTYRRPL